MGTSGQREEETEARETEGTRAQGAHGRGAMTRGHAAEVPSTAAMGSMRGTGSEGSAVEGSGDERMNERSAEDREHGEDGRDGGQRDATATPQREGDEEREQTGAARQPTAADSVISPGVTVNRPKRSNRGQPVYDQTKRRKTGRRQAREGRGRARWRRIKQTAEAGGAE